MPRIRTLKPEILEDEKTSRLSDTAFRLFASMIVLADDHGNVRADARWLQAQIWWAHSPPPNVLLVLIELWRSGLIDVYGVRGGTYATLLGWAKHQRVDNAGKGRVPSPDDPDAREVEIEGHRLARPSVDEMDEMNETDDASTGSADDTSTKTEEQARPSSFCSRDNTPRNSASRGEMRLDQEGDQEKEGEGDPRRTPRVSPARPVPRSKQATDALEAWRPREAELRLASKTGVDGKAEAERFRDYYAARGTKLSDWNAAFRGWLRKVDKFERKSGSATRAEEVRVLDDM